MAADKDRCDFVIRTLARADGDLLRSVRMRALEESPDAYVETLADAQACDWQARAARLSQREPHDRVAYVATAGAISAGMIIAGYGLPAEPPFLAAMWVHPDFRRQGLGRALVARALSFLRQAGQKHVSLWVTETHSGVFKFCEALGFQLTGARAELRAGSQTRILEMTLHLGH
jgi:GNAT superfamily N-acetyltransferase